MRINILNASVLLHQSSRCLFSDLRNARNIICRIAHQCLELNELLRIHMIFFFHIFCIIVFYFCSRALCLWDADLDLIRSDLQQIPVSRHKCYQNAFFFRTFCHRTENVIRLKAFLLHCQNAHGGKHLFHDRNLLPKLLRHWLSRPFVGIVHLMAEGRRT